MKLKNSFKHAMEQLHIGTLRKHQIQPINSILDGAALDPYSGFPAYRSACCNVRRK